MSSVRQELIEVIIDDFLVNDDTAGGGKHYNPAIARNASGRFIVAWVDYRNGNFNIYAQRFDSSGTPMGTNFKVNEDTGTVGQWYPAVISDNSGNFVITWEDERNGNSDIYAQRYDSSGVLIGGNFRINDDTLAVQQLEPAIAMDGSGSLVITWRDERNGNYDVYAQKYDSGGASVGSNFKVNDDAGTSWQGSPAIAREQQGNFIITWDDNRDGNWDVYAQRYSSSGTPVDSNFRVNDDIGIAEQWNPAVAMDGSGRFVITWEDLRNGSYNSDIYAQMYASSGIPTSSNFKVNDDTGAAHQWETAITIDSSGSFVLTWTDERNSPNTDIYAQRYSPAGTPLGTNFKVNDDTQTTLQESPAIATDGGGSFVITWADYRCGWPYSDIYVQRFHYTGIPLGANFRVNDDGGTSDQKFPSLASDAFGNFVIAWTDYRNGFPVGDIYIQRYNSSGFPINSNSRVNDELGAVFDFSFGLDIVMGQPGNFIVVWEDDRGQSPYSSSNIYAQRYNSNGTPVGSNFKVNDDSAVAYHVFPGIGLTGFGYFVIAWTDYRNGNGDVYAQRYDSSGTPLLSNFKVNDDTGTANQAYSAITMDQRGNFVIVWADGRSSPNPDIYAQKYDSSGTPIGANFKVNDDTGATDQAYPSIAMDQRRNFVITWTDCRSSPNPDIYAQRYDTSGAPLGANFKVNDDTGTAYRYVPTIAMNDSGGFVITWMDGRTGLGFDIYAQRYNSSGSPLDGNYLVTKPEYAGFDQGFPAVAISNQTIYFTWQDNRRSKGSDIYAKVVDWSWTKVEENEEENLPKSFELSQNFPNPFNAATIIPFQLKGQGIIAERPIRVTLKIYNILGQLVRTLVDEEKLLGHYNVIWDGKDDSRREIASGIYFYRIQAETFEQTKKMLLIK
jgi:hypothetical protein